MTLDKLAGALWFSTLDLLSGYWQVEVAKGDRDKTGFCTTEGLFELKAVPFGLCKASATYQHLMVISLLDSIGLSVLSNWTMSSC